ESIAWKRALAGHAASRADGEFVGVAAGAGGPRAGYRRAATPLCARLGRTRPTGARAAGRAAAERDDLVRARRPAAVAEAQRGIHRDIAIGLGRRRIRRGVTRMCSS